MRGHNSHEGYEPKTTLAAMGSANWACEVTRVLEENSLKFLLWILCSPGTCLRAATVTDRVAPNQVARVFPQSPGNSELSRMEKGAQWEMDEEELVPNYGQLLAQDRKGSRTGGPSVAMEVDRPGS